jgi:DNA-binding Xre family transcriptional regulator
MTKTVAYHWHLRKIMNEHGMNATTELVPLLADLAEVMTSTQVYRIVTGEPERLNMRLLAALCDLSSAYPNDLIEPTSPPARGASTDRHHRHQHAVKPSRNRQLAQSSSLLGTDRTRWRAIVPGECFRCGR